MPKLIDMTGQRFGRLVVIKRCASKNSRKARWQCECDCGNTVEVDGDKLRRGESKSCGCGKAIQLRTMRDKYSKADKNILRVWQGMISRCCVKSNSVYSYYGGRGISVCSEWHDDYFAFELWAKKKGYAPSLTLDRIDNDGDYSPQNCRFVDRIVQANNMRKNVVLEFNGQKMTLAEWARQLNLPYSTIHNRYRRGWPTERILTEPKQE